MKSEPTLPQNENTERAVLACILLDSAGSCYLQAAQSLTVDDFGYDSHRRIFSAMLELGEDSKPIDYTTLYEVLDARKEIQTVGLGYLTDLADISKNIRLQNISPYITTLREFSARRRILITADNTVRKAYDGAEAAELLGELQDQISLLTQRSQEKNCVPVSVVAKEVAQRLIHQHDNPQDCIGLPTGLPELDRSLSGLVNGENIVIAADPGMGKTSIALNITQENCTRDNPVQFFSLEMKRDSLLLRLASGLTGINHLHFRNPAWMSKDDMGRALNAIAEIGKWPLWIDDSGGLTPRELYARGRMQAAKGAKLIIVDFLQKLISPGASLYERVTNSSEAVRSLAKDTDVPVLNLSQLSRRKERTGQKPELHDLRDSGAIEQDAHAVIMLWSDNDGDVLLVRKNRSGPLGEIRARYEKKIMKWYPMQESIPDYKSEAAR